MFQLLNKKYNKINMHRYVAKLQFIKEQQFLYVGIALITFIAISNFLWILGTTL
jgi:hypothetical protein